MPSSSVGVVACAGVGEVAVDLGGELGDVLVVVGALELGGGGLVDDDGGVGVHLECGGGAGGGDGALDHGGDGVGLGVAVGDEEVLVGVHDGSDAHGEGPAGDLVGGGEEAGVVLDGLGGDGDESGSGLEGGAGLVEADVSVASDAEDLELDASEVFHLGLVAFALGDDVVGESVEEVDVCGVEVDVLEEVVLHEAPVALLVVVGEAEVLVEVEGVDAGEVEFAALEALGDLVVELEGRAAGGQSDDVDAVVVQAILDDGVGGFGDGEFIGDDNDFHDMLQCRSPRRHDDGRG